MRIALTWRNATIYAVVSSQIGYLAGLGVARLVMKKRLQKDFDEKLEAEIREIREAYHAMSIKRKYPTPQDRVDELKIYHEAAVAVRNYETASEEPEDPNVVTEDEKRNIFAANQDAEEDEDAYQLEVEQRDTDGPYVISEEDYMDNVPEYDQTPLTYYADGVLADDQDVPVELVERTVGSENLDRFGHFSGKTNVVYVRNDKMKTDFEITRDPTEYAVTVGGKDPLPARSLRTITNPPRLPARDRFVRTAELRGRVI